MPQLYPYRIFISHAWDYSSEYNRLVEMLESATFFEFKNYSVPKHDPFETTARLENQLLHQIGQAQVVIVLAGMYAAHSDWIQFEINRAIFLKKPIIGVTPWGQERVPQAVQDAARVMHGWNVGPIVDSIRQLA